MHLQQNQLNIKKSNRIAQYMSFETVIFMEFFSFINFTLVTRNYKNKIVPIELLTQSEIFIF